MYNGVNNKYMSVLNCGIQLNRIARAAEQTKLVVFVKK